MAKRTRVPVGQPPILTLHVSAPPDVHVAEWKCFWEGVAQAASEALNSVSSSHPDLDVMQALVRDARVAAGLPPVLLQPLTAQHHAG